MSNSIKRFSKNKKTRSRSRWLFHYQSFQLHPQKRSSISFWLISTSNLSIIIIDNWAKKILSTLTLYFQRFGYTLHPGLLSQRTVALNPFRAVVGICRHEHFRFCCHCRHMPTCVNSTYLPEIYHFLQRFCIKWFEMKNSCNLFYVEK